MEYIKVDILGEEYTIRRKLKYEEDQRLCDADAYCDESTKEIGIIELKPTEESLKDLRVYEAKLIRHEIIHAFLNESGLAECSEWATNEEMVDFFARQIPKMMKVFQKVNAQK